MKIIDTWMTKYDYQFLRISNSDSFDLYIITMRLPKTKKMKNCYNLSSLQKLVIFISILNNAKSDEDLQCSNFDVDCAMVRTCECIHSTINHCVAEQVDGASFFQLRIANFLASAISPQFTITNLGI